MIVWLYIAMVEFEQPEIDFKNHVKKFVHTIDGGILGMLESMNKDYLIVKKEVIQPIYYHIPLNKCKQLDEHALWLNISDTQAERNYLSTINEPKTNIETITFRLNESSMDNVYLEAKNRMISTNTLIVQILKRFVEWDKFEPLSGMIHIPKPVVREIFKKK